MAQLRYAAKFDPFLSLDCAPTPSTLPGAVQGKEGINFCHLATLTRYSDGHGSPRGGWESASEPGTMTGNRQGNALPCNRSADALLPNPRRVSKEMHGEESHPESRVCTKFKI